MATKNEPDQTNAAEGADPTEDLRQQNPGETTTADLAENRDQPEAETPAKR